ncbi:hypothetical protein [Anaeromusa sp.]|uniref:hypothetical protein n=1 Tax=Anaeromusa sp. TaxID=1872520 RepID=UPI002638FE92|nr:hypothetical protein [Anaeromusa sp.]MDD3157654.1 hypothetical protein [Anaeromusa sp.]
MSDDVIARLFDKIDDLRDRLARVETTLQERDNSSKWYCGVVAWTVTTALSIYAVMANK